jgi:hypothetical protein
MPHGFGARKPARTKCVPLEPDEPPPIRLISASQSVDAGMALEAAASRSSTALTSRSLVERRASRQVARRQGDPRTLGAGARALPRLLACAHAERRTRRHTHRDRTQARGEADERLRERMLTTPALAVVDEVVDALLRETGQLDQLRDAGELDFAQIAVLPGSPQLPSSVEHRRESVGRVGDGLVL